MRSTCVERKKPGRKRSQEPQKRSQEPQKGIWMAVKDNAALVTVIGALLGVLITGAINTYIANKDQAAQRELEAFNAEKQRELEQEKAQGAALQTYLDQMGQRLLNWDLHNAQEGSVLLAPTRARTLAMFEQSSPEGKRIVLVFLNEADLINKDHPIISLDGADLSEADLSEVDLSGANLVGAQLSGADLSNAEGIDNEKLERQAKSLKMATMPNGQKYEDWLKDKE
jgi:uncharacterized protein YjbI with pentapeptide repeats